MGRYHRHVEVIARHRFAHRESRTAVGAQRAKHRRISGQVGEHVVRGLEVEIVGQRRRAVLAAARRRRAGIDVNQLVGTRHRQRLEQQRVHHREQRRIEADADGQRRDRYRRKCRTAAQPSKGVSNIGEERLEQDEDYNSQL